MRNIRLVLAISALLSLPNSAMSADFYAGKTVTLIIGYSVGGGVDAYSRILARYLTNHIPGAPTVIVKNQPGAGTQIALRAVETADKDGLTIGHFEPDLVTQSIAFPDRISARYGNFTWLGSISNDPKVCYAWGATGIKTFSDMLQRPEVVMGSSGRGGSTYTNEKMLERIFGVKLKQVLGYPGTAERRLAIENGELDGDCGSYTSVPPNYLQDGKISIVLKFIQNVPGLENTTYANELVKDPDKIKLLDFLDASSIIGRAFVVPKGVPAERVSLLREGFEATVHDPAFIEESKKQNLTVSPMSGQEIEKRLDQLGATPKDIVEQAKDLLGETL